MTYPIKKLGEVFKIKSGKFLPRRSMKENGIFSVYGGNGVISKHNEHNLTGENIIIGRVGALCGNVRFVSSNIWITDNAFYVSEYLCKVNKQYLSILLNFINLGKTSNSSAQPVISYKGIKDLLIPLPSLGTQNLIVHKLNSAFKNIDESIKITNNNIENIDELDKSLLIDTFSMYQGGNILNKLSEYVKFIGGSQPPKSNFSYEIKDGYIRLIQIRDYKSDNHIVYINRQSTKKTCNETDIMIGRYGPPIFQILRGIKGAYNVALMKAVFDEKEVDTNYLYLFLKNPIIQNYIIGLSQRAAGQSGVNKTILDNYGTLFPSLSKQKEIVLYLDEILEKNKVIKEGYEKKLRELEEMKQSILKEAFEGRLVKE